MRALLSELLEALEQKRDVVYCCLVETRGSTPQKAGASMLVYPNGRQYGTLGGGCVEAEVKQKALRALHEKASADVLTFNLDSNYGWDDGLICGGRMSILADPLTPSLERERFDNSVNYYRTYRQIVERGHGCIEAVAVAADSDLEPAARYLFDQEGALLAQVASHSPADHVRDNLPPLSKRPRPSVKRGVAYLPTLPRISLLIVGGGHVGQAVAKLASEADFETWVLDDRETYASKERFPNAERVIVGDVGASLKKLVAEAVEASVYAIIVTRGHNHDEEALYHLAPSNAGYVGMIGSKRKIRLIYEDLIAKGVSEQVLSKVRAPLGLDIGSQTVPEIAVSIVAELIAARNLGTTQVGIRDRVQASTTQ